MNSSNYVEILTKAPTINYVLASNQNSLSNFFKQPYSEHFSPVATLNIKDLASDFYFLDYLIKSKWLNKNLELAITTLPIGLGHNFNATLVELAQYQNKQSTDFNLDYKQLIELFKQQQANLDYLDKKNKPSEQQFVQIVEQSQIKLIHNNSKFASFSTKLADYQKSFAHKTQLSFMDKRPTIDQWLHNIILANCQAKLTALENLLAQIVTYQKQLDRLLEANPKLKVFDFNSLIKTFEKGLVHLYQSQANYLTCLADDKDLTTALNAYKQQVDLAELLLAQQAQEFFTQVYAGSELVDYSPLVLTRLASFWNQVDFLAKQAVREQTKQANLAFYELLTPQTNEQNQQADKLANDQMLISLNGNLNKYLNAVQIQNSVSQGLLLLELKHNNKITLNSWILLAQDNLLLMPDWLYRINHHISFISDAQFQIEQTDNYAILSHLPQHAEAVVNAKALEQSLPVELVKARVANGQQAQAILDTTSDTALDINNEQLHNEQLKDSKNTLHNKKQAGCLTNLASYDIEDIYAQALTSYQHELKMLKKAQSLDTADGADKSNEQGLSLKAQELERLNEQLEQRQKHKLNLLANLDDDAKRNEQLSKALQQVKLLALNNDLHNQCALTKYTRPAKESEAGVYDLRLNNGILHQEKMDMYQAVNQVSYPLTLMLNLEVQHDNVEFEQPIGNKSSKNNKPERIIKHNQNTAYSQQKSQLNFLAYNKATSAEFFAFNKSAIDLAFKLPISSFSGDWDNYFNLEQYSLVQVQPNLGIAPVKQWAKQDLLDKSLLGKSLLEQFWLDRLLTPALNYQTQKLQAGYDYLSAYKQLVLVSELDFSGDINDLGAFVDQNIYKQLQTGATQELIKQQVFELKKFYKQPATTDFARVNFNHLNLDLINQKLATLQQDNYLSLDVGLVEQLIAGYKKLLEQTQNNLTLTPNDWLVLTRANVTLKDNWQTQVNKVLDLLALPELAKQYQVYNTRAIVFTSSPNLNASSQHKLARVKTIDGQNNFNLEHLQQSTTLGHLALNLEQALATGVFVVANDYFIELVNKQLQVLTTALNTALTDYNQQQQTNKQQANKEQTNKKQDLQVVVKVSDLASCNCLCTSLGN